MVSRQEGLAITEDEGELRAAAVEAGVDEADLDGAEGDGG